ncbi:Protein ZBED8 [Trichinella murrelli]|uniref:Protein ZBED8 n=1 Tax=Trichinella murrelli TaxID=144512 RepID=A0A0V0TB75_9BILA|nr:Protein ZBED8 [Trichinella murrelli]
MCLLHLLCSYLYLRWWLDCAPDRRGSAIVDVELINLAAVGPCDFVGCFYLSSLEISHCTEEPTGKDSVPDVLAVHCVIHRQHLVAKHLTKRLHCSLGYAIAAISKIRSILLNDRLFSQFCEQNDEEFNHLQMHTEVRWLSKGACLSRYYELFETILKFFQNKDPSLRDSLKKCKSDIAYMADLFFKFNELNLQLQGSKLNLIKMRSLISPFISKLALFKHNLGRKEFYQFPSVAALRENGEVHDDGIQVYCDHLVVLKKGVQERFQDILKMKILNWVIDLFSNSNEIEMELKEELIDLQTNEELKPKFKDGYHSFCLQKQKYLTSIPVYGEW